MIPQTLPDFPPRTEPFDVSATVRDAGGGIFVVCACMCVCVCVCFKVAVWFCSELTRAPEVIMTRWWKRLLERVVVVVLGWCPLRMGVYLIVRMCWRRVLAVMSDVDSKVLLCVCLCICMSLL